MPVFSYIASNNCPPTKTHQKMKFSSKYSKQSTTSSKESDSRHSNEASLTTNLPKNKPAQQYHPITPLQPNSSKSAKNRPPPPQTVLPSEEDYFNSQKIPLSMKRWLADTSPLTPTPEYPSPGFCAIQRRGAIQRADWFGAASTAFPSPGSCAVKRRGAVRRTSSQDSELKGSGLKILEGGGRRPRLERCLAVPEVEGWDEVWDRRV
jgi:hypothetical protein